MRCKSLLSVLACCVLVACGGGDPADELAAASEAARDKVGQAVSDNPPQNIEEAMERVGKVLSDAEPSVPAAELKALLPDEMVGLERVSYEAERAGLGIKVSKASAEYGSGEQRVSLMITDLGAVSGLARMGMELFESEVDRQDERGFERTTKYQGHRSYQRLTRHEDQSLAEIMVFVDDRFTVQLDGQNVDFDELLDALGEVDIDRLQALRQASAQ